jgi:hypothetical protein
VHKLFLPEVADDGIPGSSQQVRALTTGLVGEVIGALFSSRP